MSQYVRISPQPLSAEDAANVKVVLDAQAKAIVTKGDHALMVPPPLYVVPKKVSKTASALFAATSGSSVGPTLPPNLFQQVWPASADDNAVATTLRQQLVPAICSRNNVVLLMHGHAKSGKTCLTELLLPAVIEALKVSVASAEEAAQETLAMTGEEGEAARLHRPTAIASSPVPTNPAGGGKGGASAGASLAASTAANVSGASGSPGGGAGAGAAGDNSSSMAAKKASIRRPVSSSTNRTANTTGGSPMGKYSLLLARLPRGEGIVDMERVDMASPSNLSPHRLLPPLHRDTAGSNSRGQSPDGGGQPPTQAAPSNKWRLFTENNKCLMRLNNGLQTSLGKKNGISGETPFMTFDGNGGVLENASCTVFDKVLKLSELPLQISMWVRCCDVSQSMNGAVDPHTSQQAVLHVCDMHDSNLKILLVTNTNDVGMFETNQVHVTVRDGHGKKLEIAFATTAFSDCTWHFVVLNVYKKDSKAEMFVDDRLCRFKVGSSESLSAFSENRNRCCTLGAELVVAPDMSKKHVNFFSGQLVDLAIGEGNNGRCMALFPFRDLEPSGQYGDTVRPSNGGGIFNRVNNNSAAAAAALEASPSSIASGSQAFAAAAADGSMASASMAPQPCPTFVPSDFIATSPMFDGYDSFVNMGPMGDVGLMANVQVEVVFRTSCTNERMCLLGVHDGVGKQPGFGIELNTNSQQQLQRYSLMFWVQDRNGNCVRCIADASDVFDDHWHTLTIRVVDPAANRFKIKIDGKQMEYAVFTNGAPLREFLCYVQYVTLGCINVRGTHKRFFRGACRKLKVGRIVDDVEHPIGEWLLNEGPGAQIAMDSTGHGLNGIYYSKAGVKGSKFMPSDDPFTTATEETSLLAGIEGTIVQRYLNNQVTAAICSIDVSIDPAKGCARETIRDYIHGRTLTSLEAVDVSSFNSRMARDDHRSMLTIPEECFKRLYPADYVATVKTALSKAERRDVKRSHLVVIVRIGDAMFTMLDPASYTRSHRAMFVPSQLQWSDAASIFGPENKMNFYINTSLGKADKILATVGARPQLYKRSLFQRLTTPGVSDNMLCNILLFALVAAKERAMLSVVHMLSPVATLSEAQHSLSLTCAMRDAMFLHAVLVLQKLFRWKRAYKRFQQLLKNRHAAEARTDKMAQMKRQCPKDCIEKEKRVALLVCCLDFEYDPAMPRVSTKYDDVQTVPRLLEQNGYQTEIMLNPSRANLLAGLARKKADQQRLDASLLVYFIGLSAQDQYHQLASLSVRQSWLAEHEREVRLGILLSGRKDLADIFLDERDDYEYVDNKLKAAAEELAKKAAKKKKAKGAAPDPAILALEKWPPKPRMYTRDELLRAMAAWDERLAPTVPTVVETPDNSAPWANASKPLFFCVGDTRAMTTPDQTITLAEIQAAIMAPAASPKRGEHVMLAYDTLPFESSTNFAHGVAGLIASSGESVTIEYKKGQQLLMGYYMKRILQGCAVELGRIGKHDPPIKTSIELASKFLLKKFDPATGAPFAAQKVSVHWFGEFVGEMYLCPKLVSKKEDRKKAKAQVQGKKGLAKVTFALTSSSAQSAVPSDYKLQIQSRLTKLLKLPSADLRRPSFEDYFDFHVPADFNTLQSHEIAKKAITAALSAMCRTPVPAADASLSAGLKWYGKKASGPLIALEVHPIPPAKAQSNNLDMDGGGAKDQKQQATEFVAGVAQRDQLVDARILKCVNALKYPTALLANVYPIHRATVYLAGTIVLGDEECLKLERLSRTGGEFLPTIALKSIRMLSEKEMNELEQSERLFAIDEATKQAEMKARLVAEAEARKKADEEMARLLQRKDGVVQRVMQIKSSGQFTAADVDYCLSVPLPDAIAPIFEALAVLATKATFPSIKQLVLSKVPALPPVFLQDARLLGALWRFTATVAQAVEDDETAGKLLSVVLLPTVAQGQAAALAPALGKQVAAALTAVAVRTGKVFLDAGVAPVVAPLWPKFKCDGMTDELRQMFVPLVPAVRDALHPAMAAAFKPKDLFLHVSLVLAVAPLTGDDVEAVLLAITADHENSYAEKEMVDAFVGVLAASKMLPVLQDAGVQTAMVKLVDPVTTWSAASGKALLAALGQMELSDKQTAALQPIVAKATAAAT